MLIVIEESVHDDREDIKMGKIYIIMGKSASGKDTIYRNVAAQLAQYLNTVIMYTTRPIRSGEVNGREYFYVTEDEYQNYKKLGSIIEERCYHTIHGDWKYFTVEDGQINLEQSNYIMIGTLETYDKLIQYFGRDCIIPLYIEVDTGERLERALARERQQQNPKYTELCRRFLADEEDFSEEKVYASGIKKRYKNIKIEDCTSEIVSDIRNSL